MTNEEKQAIQIEVMNEFQRQASEKPFMLLDVLLQGTGVALIFQVLGAQGAYARRRSDTLGYLLQQIRKELAVSEPQETEE